MQQSIKQSLKILAGLALLIVVVLFAVPDIASFPQWPAVEMPHAQAPITAANDTAEAPRVIEIERGATPQPVAAPQQDRRYQRVETPGAREPGSKTFHRPVAVSATSFEAEGQSFALAGVEPLPFDATCQMGEAQIRCGALARTALRGWLRGRSISCDFAPGAEAPQRGQCRIGNDDVAGWLVRQGWARPVAGGPYEDAGKAAEEAGLGLWQYDDIAE